MFITRKRFEEELEKARENGFNQAMELRNRDDQFRCVHERIDYIQKNLECLADRLNNPKPVGFETGERKC